MGLGGLYSLQRLMESVSLTSTAAGVALLALLGSWSFPVSSKLTVNAFRSLLRLSHCLISSVVELSSVSLKDTYDYI